MKDVMNPFPSFPQKDFKSISFIQVIFGSRFLMREEFFHAYVAFSSFCKGDDEGRSSQLSVWDWLLVAHSIHRHYNSS